MSTEEDIVGGKKPNAAQKLKKAWGDRNLLRAAAKEAARNGAPVDPIRAAEAAAPEGVRGNYSRVAGAEAVRNAPLNTGPAPTGTVPPNFPQGEPQTINVRGVEPRVSAYPPGAVPTGVNTAPLEGIPQQGSMWDKAKAGLRSEALSRGMLNEAGKVSAKGVGKAALQGLPVVGTAIEGGLQAGGVAADAPYLTPGQQVMRAGEGFVNTGLAGIGGLAGNALGMGAGPVGSLAGGAAGTVVGATALKVGEQALKDYGIIKDSILPSSIAEDERKWQEMIKTRTAAAQKQNALAESVAEQEQHGGGSTNLDVTGTPPKLRNALDMPTQSGEGYVSNADGSKIMGVRKGFFPDSSGMPTIAQTNAAARAEMDAMDARSAAKDKALYDSRDRQNLESGFRQAQYDRQVALGRQDRGMLAEADARVKEFGAQIAQGNASKMELEKSKQGVDALKYGADQGLRGHQIAADAAVKGHQIGADATLGAAGLKAQYDAYKLGLEKEDLNRKEKGPWLTSQFRTQGVDNNGKPFTTDNPKAEQDFEKYVLAHATTNPEWLKKQGVSKVDQLTTTQLQPLVEAYKRDKAITDQAASITDKGNDVPMGLPKAASIAPVKFSDAFDFKPGQQNSISAWQALNGQWNPFTAGKASELAVTIKNNQGADQKYMLSDLDAHPEMRADVIDKLPPDQKKAMLARYGDPQTNGFRK
jgi:hypothetical protein